MDLSTCVFQDGISILKLVGAFAHTLLAKNQPKSLSRTVSETLRTLNFYQEQLNV